MKKLFVLFTFVLLSVVTAKPMIAHTPNVVVTDCAIDELTGGAYLTIAGKFGGEITIKELARNTSLEIHGCAAGAKIFQFVLVIGKGSKSQSYEGDSNSLTKEMHMKLKQLSKGDEFTFTGVKAHLNATDDVDVMAKKFYIV